MSNELQKKLQLSLTVQSDHGLIGSSDHFCYIKKPFLTETTIRDADQINKIETLIATIMTA